MSERADPLALHAPLAARLFLGLLERRMARAFSALRVSGAFGQTGAAGDFAESTAGRPLVVYCNHPAWWDVGVLAAVARRMAPGRRLFAPFDAAALGRYGFLVRCGAFGVDPGSAGGARRLLEVGGRVLGDPGSLLCITPEGAFTDPRVRPVVLKRGLATLLARTPGTVAVPVAIEYPFWTESRPEALVRVGRPVALPAGDAADADAWQSCLTARLEATMDALAADAVARDPARFRTLIDGSAGVGGVYDAWRRLRAAAAGRRFDARHGAADPVARDPAPP